jgi:mannonate dehydratase
VSQVVGAFNRQDSNSWHLAGIKAIRDAYRAGGFDLAVVESRPPMEKIKLGLPGRDEEIDEVCLLIEAMGELGIPCWCYEWMPILNWIRTTTDIESRGGALVTGFDATEAAKLPIIDAGGITEDELWNNLKYFLERVLPVAESADVRLAMHPDDPPISVVRGIPRIMRSIEAFDRLIDIVRSPMNGIALCQGNFALMSDDLPAIIRRWGSERIFFVHMRDVIGTSEHFEETFHDAGQTDMPACIRAYCDIGYDGVCRPDHVPTMAGDGNDRPGYSDIGRLFAIGYLRGIIHSIYGKDESP